MKKYLLGTFAIVLAIGFSAFTTKKTHEPKLRFGDYVFVHLAHSTSDTRTDYVFRATPAGCEESGNICKSIWTQSTPPTTEGENPLSTAVQGTKTFGDYSGN